jgi:hypothetical protein
LDWQKNSNFTGEITGLKNVLIAFSVDLNLVFPSVFLKMESIPSCLSGSQALRFLSEEGFFSEQSSQETT